MTLHLPRDFERWAECVELTRDVGKAEAAFFLTRLWVELAYAVEMIGVVGLLPASYGQRFNESCEDERAIERLLKSGLLEEVVDRSQESGVRGQSAQLTPDSCILTHGFICRRFALCNPHLAPGYKTPAKRAQEMSLYGKRLRKFVNSGQVTQVSLMVPDECWIKPDETGEKMAHEEVSQVLVLIRAVDNALGAVERPANGVGYPATLTQDAWRVLKRFSNEQIDFLCRWIVGHREHASLPPTTEQLLPRFEELVRAVETQSQS